MPSDPTEITLMLSVSGGGDAFGPFFATLNLNKVEIERLLHRADVFRAAKSLEFELYQMTYFDYSPEFFESGKEEGAEKIVEIFENECYPTDGLRETKPGEVPEQGNVRLDYCKLIVAGTSMSRELLDKVTYRWEACIKHTSEEIETCEITEEVIRALLARLS